MSSHFPTPSDETGVITQEKAPSPTKKPPLFRVLMHNDDYTTRDFVVHVLMHIFQKSEPDSIKIMMHVHLNGVGVAGVYTREIGETKIKETEHLARKYEFPLALSLEPADDGEEN